MTHHVEEILPCFSHVLLMKDGKNIEANARETVLTDELLSDFFGREISLQIERERAWVAIK
ncbi:MAG: hypothetical protein ABS960_10925 [Solibacillus isronensis]